MDYAVIEQQLQRVLDAKRMQAHIEQEIAQLRIPTVEFMVG